MSSDGSVSSGSQIRQFGLYRTIDARTEEFLRLSRKRQIRQGCACAAASTAITVTVLIIVFFVYEFSLNSETNIENTLKSHWFSLMNDTAENSSFASKISKNNIDRTTLKLLPLLIKAINKDSFLEKLLEDYVTSSPAYDKQEATEDTIEAIKSFSRNWLKMPTTKLYAIEYKTSPVVYYKDPTKSIDYYTKVRKIRDYQRVFNYVDKMISEKVYIRATRPMPKEEFYTEVPPVMKSRPFKKTTQRSVVTPPKAKKANFTNKTNGHHDCKCPKKLGLILNKILSSIQKLLPNTVKKNTTLVNCATKKPTPSMLSNSNLITTTNNALNIDSVTSEKPSISESTPIARTFAFETDLVTEADAYPSNNINSPPQANSNEHTTGKDFSADSFKLQNLQKTNQPIKFINKYQNIIQRQELLRNSGTKISKSFYEPIFGGIEYDEYMFYSTSTPAQVYNTRINNEIDFIKTKLNYLHNIKQKVKEMKNQTKPSDMYKTLINSAFNPKTPARLDVKVVENTNALVKTNSTHTVKTNISLLQNPTNLITNKVYKVKVDTTTPLTNNTSLTTAEKLFIDLFKSKTFNTNKSYNSENLREVKYENYQSDSSTKKVNLKVNLVTPRTIYFDQFRDNKTVYRLIKNNITSFSTNKLITDRPNYVLNNLKSTYLPKNSSIDSTKGPYSQLSDRNKTIYRLVGKNNKTPIRQKTSSLGDMLYLRKKLIESQKPRHVNDIDVLTHKTKSLKIEFDKDKHNSNTVTTEDDAEFFTGDISEITKQPESVTDSLDKSNFTKKTEYEFTWEDLVPDEDKPAVTANIEYDATREAQVNENVVEVKSMVPEPKRMYLEFHRNTVKHEEPQEDDYNINSNFYDLNI